MNSIVKMALSTSLLLVTSLAFACDYPDRPHIPDGSTASKEELLAAKSGVQSYLAAVDDYLSCVENEEQEAIDESDDTDPEMLKRRDKLLNQKFDAANEEKALIGEQFNQQVRAYNEQRKKASE